MFRALINEAKSAAGSLVGKYMVRASVAVPFLAATGFATTAVTLMLIESYGAITASWIVAGGFFAIGLIGAAVVTNKENKERDEQAAGVRAEQAHASEAMNAAVSQATAQAPLALLGALLTTPLAPNALAGGAKMIARNAPLVVLLAGIAFLLWTPQATGSAGADAREDEARDDAPDEKGDFRMPREAESDFRRAA